MKFKEKMSIAISLSLGFMCVTPVSIFCGDGLADPPLKSLRMRNHQNYRTGWAVQLQLYR